MASASAPDRQDVAALVADLVADRDAHGIEAVEHVELGDADARQAVQLHGALQRGGVEPAGSAAAGP
jgi:hypothetical protein